MRILFLNYEYPPLGGGAGNASAAILREYAKMPELEVDFVTSSTDESYHLETLGENICVHKLSIGKRPDSLTLQSNRDIIVYAWKAYWFSRKLIKKNHYDLTHSFFTVPCGFLSLVFRYQYGLPYIVSLRGSDVPGYSARFSFLYHFLRPLSVFIWKKAAKVVSNSAVLRTLALESSPKQPIDIIYNGVDTVRFVPDPKHGPGTSDEFRIFCASRLSHRKGFRYAIEAFSLLAEKYPQMRMTIAGGEGDAEQDLRRQVKDLGLEEKVTFSGHYTMTEEFMNRYRSQDVFVFPSLNEGMSNNMLEAMAFGLPIIMTPTGGAEELIRDGENGYIVKMKDAKDIAEKLERLINDRELLKRMGQESRRTAERMSWKSVAQGYADMYKQVAQKS